MKRVAAARRIRRNDQAALGEQTEDIANQPGLWRGDPAAAGNGGGRTSAARDDDGHQAAGSHDRCQELAHGITDPGGVVSK
jgi:hypothetical protein